MQSKGRLRNLENWQQKARFSCSMLGSMWWEVGSRGLFSPDVQPRGCRSYCAEMVVWPSFKHRSWESPWIPTVKHQLASWADGSSFNQQCRGFSFQVTRFSLVTSACNFLLLSCSPKSISDSWYRIWCSSVPCKLFNPEECLRFMPIVRLGKTELKKWLNH